MRKLTKTEDYIIAHTAEQADVAPSTVRRIYQAFLGGAECANDAPEHVQDLWREAQERKGFGQ